MECVIETKASMILQFFDGLQGDLHVTFEEGTWAAWLYELLKPHVTKLVVCDPRRNVLLQDGNQNDRVDARKLSDLLYMNKLNAVHHGDHGLRTLKELGRSYLTMTEDQSRVAGNGPTAIDGFDPAHGDFADSTPVPHQATAVDLLRL